MNVLQVTLRYLLYVCLSVSVMLGSTVPKPSSRWPSFTISAAPASLTIVQGSHGTSVLTISIGGRFNSSIMLSISGAPAGSSVVLVPNLIAAPGAGTSTMTMTIAANTPAGPYPITVTGMGGGIKGTVALLVTVTSALTYDTYGGLALRPVPGCRQTNFFQLQKFNNRWVLTTPECNVFQPRAVYDADSAFLSRSVMDARYGNDKSKWATHSLQRMQAYGFNSLDIYYSTYMLPTGTYGSGRGASLHLPFYLFWPTTNDVVNHPASLGLPEAVKDICQSRDGNGLHGYCGYTLDAFDPKWAAANDAEIAIQATGPGATYTGGFADNPWVMGISLGDTDMFFALKGNGAGSNGVAQYPHPSMLIATGNFDFGKAWSDPKLHSKYAWSCDGGNSYLEKKYGTISALNAAWNTGGFYTSFCDAGGFGIGSGVLDEDGRHISWFGKDYYNQAGMNAKLLADLDAFLYQFAYQAYSAQITALRGYDTNHLFVCGNFGGTGNGGARKQVLEGLRDAGCSLIVLDWDSTYPEAALATNRAAYDAIGLPATLWYGVSAQADSDMSQYLEYGGFDSDYATQARRGQQFARDQQAIFGSQGSNGDYYVLGTSYWSLTDNSSVKINWGLLSLNDNAYDGKCAVKKPGTDSWGVACGGEVADYGDFIDAVTESNASIEQQLVQQLE